LIDNTTERSKLPKWLQDTQNKSWEPEIIISGLMLTSLFILPTKLFEFCGMLVQDFGVEYISAWLILIYLSIIINIFKIFFIVHLLVRLAWTGMVGLSYAFPKGVINENLFKVFSHHEFKKPAELVIKLERWCSIMFAFPVYIGIIFIIISFILFLFLSISTYFELSIMYAIGIIVFIALVYFISSLLFKNSAISRLNATSIPSTISSIYQSNLGKWPVQISVVVLMLTAFPSVVTDINGFDMFLNASQLNDKWLPKSEFYYDNHEEEQRFARSFINSAIVKEQHFMELNVAYYAEDERTSRKYKEQVIIDNSLDSLNWKSVNTAEDLINIYLNDSLIQIEEWQYLNLPYTNQRVYNTFIDISHIPMGLNHIRVEKLTFANIEPIVTRWRVRDKWALIPFFKTTN